MLFLNHCHHCATRYLLILRSVLSLLMGTHQFAPMGICSTREVLLLRGVIEIKVPNCSDQTLVIQAECDDITNRRVFTCESRRVNITRRLNGLVHGILACFLLLTSCIFAPLFHTCMHTQVSFTTAKFTFGNTLVDYTLWKFQNNSLKTKKNIRSHF